MSDILAEICAIKRQHVAARRAIVPETLLRVQAVERKKENRGFARCLQQKTAAREVALIAEVKKASPSKGIIRADFDPVAIARAYAQGGATCLSVLTDQPYFQGDDAYLSAVRSVVTLPLLRKDFMLEPYQIYESKTLGADAILLIMAALSDAQALELYEAAEECGLDVLIEVHEEAELSRALALPGRLIGINHRNLKTMEVNLALSERLLPQVPAGYTIIAESGIYSAEDIRHLQRVGIYGFLVGESLMREADVEAAVRRLLAAI